MGAVFSWKREIRKLMKQFLIPKEKINSIIDQTINESTSADTEMQMYNRAWRKFKDICNEM